MIYKKNKRSRNLFLMHPCSLKVYYTLKSQATQNKTKPNCTAPNCTSRHSIKGYSWRWTGTERSDEIPALPHAPWGPQVLELNFESGAANSCASYSLHNNISRKKCPGWEKGANKLYHWYFSNCGIRHISTLLCILIVSKTREAYLRECKLLEAYTVF